MDEDDYSGDDYSASIDTSEDFSVAVSTEAFAAAAPPPIPTAADFRAAVSNFHHIEDLVGGNPLSHQAPDDSETSSGSAFSNPWVLAGAGGLLVLGGILLVV